MFRYVVRIMEIQQRVPTVEVRSFRKKSTSLTRSLTNARQPVRVTVTS
jgi:hypothetical protein